MAHHPGNPVHYGYHMVPIVDGVTRMMGHSLARFWPKNIFFRPLKGLNLAFPGTPGTYFDTLYPAKIDSVPGQPKK